MSAPHLPPRSPQASALKRFLTAEPEEWPRLAPRVVEEAGVDTLERIVRATMARVGTAVTVLDGPEGPGGCTAGG
ncbi:hypothetical protein [Streptomyces sp. AGS-58]|uniref:hypothetical protein n=1 Tax=unclassified Streptomyces TaxID=2593676 RepID=UPI0035A272EA